MEPGVFRNRVAVSWRISLQYPSAIARKTGERTTDIKGHNTEIRVLGSLTGPVHRASVQRSGAWHSGARNRTFRSVVIQGLETR